MNVKVDHTIVNKNASILGVDMFVLVTSDLNSRKTDKVVKKVRFFILYLQQNILGI
jgi:hypothetical protein